MSEQQTMIDKLEFMLGKWDLIYQIPQSHISDKREGKGKGTLKKALDGNYVFFDYEVFPTLGPAAAHGIFTWDKGEKCYRYWWFESSGKFLSASGKIENDGTLFLQWDTISCRQTFTRKSANQLILKMECQNDEDLFVPVLEVSFKRTLQTQ